MDKEIIVMCKKHGIKYNAYDGRCPQCEADSSALKYIQRWLTCQLCGEIKASVQQYAGGPIGLMCDDCHAIIVKWEEAKDEADEFWKNRRIEVDSQIFFRATFDNDPVEAIWG